VRGRPGSWRRSGRLADEIGVYSPRHGRAMAENAQPVRGQPLRSRCGTPGLRFLLPRELRSRPARISTTRSARASRRWNCRRLLRRTCWWPWERGVSAGAMSIYSIAPPMSPIPTAPFGASGLRSRTLAKAEFVLLGVALLDDGRALGKRASAECRGKRIGRIDADHPVDPKPAMRARPKPTPSSTKWGCHVPRAIDGREGPRNLFMDRLSEDWSRSCSSWARAASC